MKTADLITSFLNNEMTPEQERQFLLSVAASDSMRLSLKSHVMLDRISANQLHRAEVPVPVREAIFAQMSASMAEPAPRTAAPDRPMVRPGAGGGSLTGGFLRKFGNRALVMVLTAGGFVAGYLTHSELPGADPAPNQAQQQVRMTPSGSSEVAQTPSAPAASPQPATELRSEQRVEESAPVTARPERGGSRLEREPIATRSQVRSTATNASSRTSTRAVTNPVTPLGNPSSPLEPAGGVNNAQSSSSSAAAGVSSDDSLNLKTAPASSVSIQPTIRSSSGGSKETQTQKGD